MNRDKHTVMVKHTYVGVHKYRQAYSSTLKHSKHMLSPDSCPSYVYATSLAQLFYLVKGDSAWLHCCPTLKSVFVSCLVASSSHQEQYEWELKGEGLILRGWLSFKPLERQGSLQQRTSLPCSSFLVAPMIQKLSLNTSFVQKCIFP